MSNSFEVLLVIDNADQADMIADALDRAQEKHFHVQRYDQLQPALDHLRDRHADILLLDLDLPDSHGLDTFRQAQRHASSVAIVVLCGLHDATIAMRAVREGAHEYLVKGQFDDDVLVRSIRYAVERAEARRALLEIEALYHSMVESLPMNLFRKDLDGRIVFGNRRYCDTVGEPLKRLIGKTDYDLFPAELAAKYVGDDRRVMETGEMMEDIEEHVGGDGSTIYVHVMKSPIRDAHGHILGIQGLFWDVSDHKRTEAALLEAKNDAEAANEAKSQFLANISHEVRTPMNAILGMTELLLATKLTDEQHEYIGLVHKSGEVLLGLLNDVLDFSKIEAGHMQLESTPFSIRDCIDDAISLLAAGAHHKRLEFACRVDPRVPDAVVGDSHRLRQILVNLLGNALKFTQQGEVVMEVNCLKLSKERIELGVSVRDTGIGINEDKLAHIFEAFEQGDGSTTRKYGGTGLGLAIANELVQAMGGQLVVESRLGEGSRFRFSVELPIADGDRETVTSDSRRLKGKRILVIDDHEPSRESVVEMLQHHGFDAAGAADAGEVLEKLRSATAAGGTIAVVFVDASLDGSDGFSLAEQISQVDGLSPAIVMMLTADRFSEDLHRCQQLQLAGHLMKPVKQSEALRLLGANPVLNAKPRSPAYAGQNREPGEACMNSTPDVCPRNVLVVEDGEVNQKVVVRLLEKQGHSVTAVDDGRQAVDAAANGYFDLVLMDLQMPVMDGIEATAEIRRLEATTNRRLPIIALTAHAFEGERKKCLAAGMDGYLTKPLSGERLSAAIAEIAVGTATRQPEVEAFSSSSTADWETALAAAHGDQQLLQEIIDIFRAECPKLLGELRSAVATADHDAWNRAAHTLKGSIRHFGAARAVATAAKLEKMGQSHDDVGVHEVLQQFERELDALQVELGQFIMRCGSKS